MFCNRVAIFGMDTLFVYPRVQLKITHKSVPNQNTTTVYTDDSKLDGRVGAGFYAEYLNNFLNQAFFLPRNTLHCVLSRGLVISEVTKNLQ